MRSRRFGGDFHRSTSAPWGSSLARVGALLGRDGGVSCQLRQDTCRAKDQDTEYGVPILQVSCCGVFYRMVVYGERRAAHNE